MSNQWIHKIIVDANPARRVYPINDKEIIFIRDKQDDEKVFYDRKLKNKFKFANDAKNGVNDFDWFYSYETSAILRCKEFLYKLYRVCNNEEILEWEGKFSLNDGEWDLDQCTFEVKPEPDTIYTCLKNNKNKEVNILDVPNIISTSTNLSYNYEFFYFPTFGGSPTFPGTQTATWTLFYQNLNHSYIKDCTTYNIHLKVYYREATITSCIAGSPNPPPGSGWLLETNNCGTSATCKWVRTPIAGSLPYASSVAIGWYNNLLSQDELPPFPKFKSINVSNVPPSEDLQYLYTTIVGQKQGTGGIDPDWYMEVPNNPNSTYSWSLSPSSTFVAIVTGTTNECKITMNDPFNFTGTVIARLTETHGNAFVSVKDYVINFQNIDSSLSGMIISQSTVLGPSAVCKSQTTVQYSIPKQPDIAPNGFFTPSISAIVWTVTGGAIITGGQGTRNVTITTPSTTGSFTVKASWTITVVNSSIPAHNYSFTYENSKTITVSDMPTTDDILTVVNRYPNEPGLVMSVQEHVSATYNWYSTTASLGAGLSLLGRNFLGFTTPSSIGSHCYFVKETINCNCSSWIKITGTPIPTPIPYTAMGYFPPIYWCAGSSVSAAVNYTRNRSFKEVIEYVIDELGCDINGVVSDFFEWNPPGDTPGYVPGYNYVTGLPNMLTNMTIAQKSDIISYTSSNAATKGMITLDKLEKIWAWKFNAYWFVDAFGRFRIEHISWFNRTVAYNANANPHAIYNVAKNKYTYNKEKMPKFEVFKDSEMMFTDFVGTPIYYDSICVNQDSANNSKDRFLDFVTTDLYALYLDPAAANKVGFVLMVNDKIGTTYTVASETGAISGNTIVNGHLSWANLHPAYHTYNRVLITGFMNNVLTTFDSAKPTKKQKDVALKICCDDVFDPLVQLYRTELGDGVMDEDEENMKTGIYKMTLNHD